MNNITYQNLKSYVGDKKVVLFGAGRAVVSAANVVRNIMPVAYLCDNDRRKHGKRFLGIEIKSPAVLKDEDQANLVVVVTVLNNAAQEGAERQLKELGVTQILFHSDLMTFMAGNSMVLGKKFHIAADDQETKAKIKQLYEVIEDDDYSKELLDFIIESRMGRSGIDLDFIYRTPKTDHPPYFSYEIYGGRQEKEVIICGGLEDGEDFRLFYKYLGNSLKKAYGFEPGAEQYACADHAVKNMKVMDYQSLTMKKLSELVEIKLYPYALAECKGEMYFSDMFVSADEAGEKVECIGIDEIIDLEEPVTLIKLDIEGAELDTLKGAVKTITKHKPRLLVCLYHRPADLWEIPLFVKSLSPGYKLYIRPHDTMKSVLELHAVHEV